MLRDSVSAFYTLEAPNGGGRGDMHMDVNNTFPS